MNAVYELEKSSQSGDSFGALRDEKNSHLFVSCVLIKENM